MAIATSTAILWAAATAAVSTGVSVTQNRQASKKASSAADTQMRQAQASQDALVAKEEAAKAELAQSQKTAATQAANQVANRKRAIARSQTVYTSPLGVGGTAETARKVLLGN